MANEIISKKGGGDQMFRVLFHRYTKKGNYFAVVADTKAPVVPRIGETIRLPNDDDYMEKSMKIPEGHDFIVHNVIHVVGLATHIVNVYVVDAAHNDWEDFEPEQL